MAIDKVQEADFFTAPEDRQLAQWLAPLRDAPVPDDGFSDRVMAALPRRDMSLWVILVAVLAGLAAAVGIMGVGQTVDLYHAFIGFFTALMGGEMPSVMSLTSVAAVVTVLVFVFYSLLDTGDEPVEYADGPAFFYEK